MATQLTVNPNLLWDYEFTPEEQQDEAFRRWYIARVLTRGTAKDIQAIGLSTILAYLPHLILPAEIRHFWDWYSSLPETRTRYGHPASSTT